MDAGTLRIVLIVLGVLLLVVLYFWERRRIESEAEPEERAAVPSTAAQRREPHLAGRFDDDAVHAEVALSGGGLSSTRDQTDSAAVPDPAADMIPDEADASSAGGGSFKEAEPAGPEASSAEEQRATSSAPDGEAGLLVQLFVVARRSAFDGSAVRAAAERHHLTPGEMDIYHRRNLDNSHEPVLFSMANLVKPGTFPLEEMEQFTTPGVALFTQLEGLPSDLMVYDELVQTARTMADELGGELLLPDRRPFDDDAWEGLRIELLSLINDRADALASGTTPDQSEESRRIGDEAGNDPPPSRP